MIIGFDLDEVFVSHPPLIPSSLILKLYGEKANGKLTYRIPGTFEQYVRKISHISLLRPPLQKNIEILKEKAKKSHIECFLISSRYSFLQKETDVLLEKYKLSRIFKKVFLNYENLQPHLFKERVLKKIKIERYVDDDLPLLLFLAPKFPRIHFFWLNKDTDYSLKTNLHAITKFASVFDSI